MSSIKPEYLFYTRGQDRYLDIYSVKEENKIVTYVVGDSEKKSLTTEHVKPAKWRCYVNGTSQ